MVRFISCRGLPHHTLAGCVWRCSCSSTPALLRHLQRDYNTTQPATKCSRCRTHMYAVPSGHQLLHDNSGGHPPPPTYTHIHTATDVHLFVVPASGVVPPLTLHVTPQHTSCQQTHHTTSSSTPTWPCTRSKASWVGALCCDLSPTQVLPTAAPSSSSSSRNTAVECMLCAVFALASKAVASVLRLTCAVVPHPPVHYVDAN